MRENRTVWRDRLTCARGLSRLPLNFAFLIGKTTENGGESTECFAPLFKIPVDSDCSK